jgi:hypothetical protein
MLLVALFGAVALGLTSAAAGSSSGTGPSAVKQAIAASWPPANAAPPAPKVPSSIPAAPPRQAPPNAGQIVMQGNPGFQVPISSEAFTATSLWADVRSNALLEIFGGTDGQDTSRGAIFVVVSANNSALQFDPSGLYPAPSGVGPITLTAVSGDTVTFKTSGGGTGTFDLATQTFRSG